MAESKLRLNRKLNMIPVTG